jgi:tetratricopeptide (TPR) repeat protein
VSLNLGSLHLRRDDFQKSAHHYREAAVLFARVGDRELSVMADIGLAGALTALGDFDEAMRILARAAMRAGTYGLPVLEAIIEESVALIELARGHYRDALAGFEGSRRRYEQLGMPQNLAIAEKQLADAYLELHLLPEALALYAQALTKFRALDMPDDEAWTLAQNGRVQILQGDPEGAADSLVRAAGSFAAQGNGVGEAAVALVRAELALLGNDAGAALDLSGLAEQGFAAADLPDRRAWADVVRAHSLLRAGRADEARVLFDATLVRGRDLQLLPVQVRCLTGQGMAARAAGDADTARAAFRGAVELFEEMRRTLPGDEIRSAFLTDHLRPYQELLRMAVDDHAAAGSTAQAAEVLRQLDRLRARALGERLARGTDPEFGAHPEAGAHTADLRTRLNWLYRRVRRLQDEAMPSAALTAELRSTEHELLERARRQRLAAPDRQQDADPDDDAYVSVEALQALLNEGDALVEYGVIDDELFACVITRADVVLQRRVADWPAVLEAAQSARFQIETLRHGAAPVARHLDILTERAQRRMRHLHALVWAPLAGALAQCRRVLIVPHAQLGALPFAALHDAELSLSQRYELAFAPSARVALRGLRRQPAPVRHALVLGESTRLPHAADEARVVAGLFPQAHVFVGDNATLEALHAHAGDADVIHLACHAQFRSDNPMFSALHLTDGALTVEATEALSLKPCTVVLSACETALAEQGNGDEMVGLVRAFLVAGAARVLASLWPVDDEITSRFMSHFHGALCRDMTPAAALRVAQSEVMREHPHPYYWAAFTLHGRW